ncbi:MAG: tRNA uridine-5-carboxymethylaminomethyl(34) synthesis GTPase MnmE [Gemmatimonadota bacterium]|nr:tRNA uridine-5-carboxymethylaminomethyl(34) synthesis GTPase MnmE [Gemmatimonadota bacterium]
MGALALVRLSGPAAYAIGQRHIQPWPSKPRTAQLCTVHKLDEVLDQSLVTLFPASRSFTGDDTVEISTHGGYLVPASIIAALISSGARQALPGEFTRRAVLNGKLDILQAEAIGDLIDARSRAMQHAALGQLDGGLSRRLLQLREDLIGLESLIAYDIDFPEEDDGPVPRAKIENAIGKMVNSLEALLATAPAGELIREGAVVVIAGPPNAGKSSLFNSLLGRSRAIVTELPGTTRDALEAVVDSGKWPLRLVDTAGLRDTTDPIELLGIEVSESYLASAAVVLACAENSEGLDQTIDSVGRKSNAPVITVRTKADLGRRSEGLGRDHVVQVSAKTGEGLQTLLDAINDAIASRYGEAVPDLPILTRARHQQALTTALLEIRQFQQAWREERLPAPVASVHLRAAVYVLEELIGAVDVEDVLDRVFSSFCVGK